MKCECSCVKKILTKNTLEFYSNNLKKNATYEKSCEYELELKFMDVLYVLKLIMQVRGRNYWCTCNYKVVHPKAMQVL